METQKVTCPREEQGQAQNPGSPYWSISPVGPPFILPLRLYHRKKMQSIMQGIHPTLLAESPSPHLAPTRIQPRLQSGALPTLPHPLTTLSLLSSPPFLHQVHTSSSSGKPHSQLGQHPGVGIQRPRPLPLLDQVLLLQPAHQWAVIYLFTRLTLPLNY